MNSEVTRRKNLSFGGRSFILQIVQGDESNFSVELFEDGEVPTLCYAADMLEQIDAEIEYERVLDDLAAFV